jgi:hypothetical protein
MERLIDVPVISTTDPPLQHVLQHCCIVSACICEIFRVALCVSLCPCACRVRARRCTYTQLTRYTSVGWSARDMQARHQAGRQDSLINA